MQLVPGVVAGMLLLGAIIVKRKDAIVWPLLVVLGGGVSNFSDLIRFGYVRDPLSIGTFIFNVADIFILLGTIWALLVYTKR